MSFLSEHSNGHGEDSTTSDEKKEHQKLEEDEEYYLDQFGLEGLHQIGKYTNFFLSSKYKSILIIFDIDHIFLL